MATRYDTGALQPAELREPPWARFLFADTRASVLWLIVRLYLGWQWLSAGWEKLTSAAWTGSQSGVALTGFVKGALAKTGGANPNVQGWYADFLRSVVLPHTSLWSHLIAYGETLVGVALILGALTGVAAFFGIVMNANYLLSGAVSTNPILIILGALVMLAWRNAGWLGLDRWLLPLLGTPWQPGSAFTRQNEGSTQSHVRDTTGSAPGAAYADQPRTRRESERDLGRATRGDGARVEGPADAMTGPRIDDRAEYEAEEGAAQADRETGDGGPDPLS